MCSLLVALSTGEIPKEVADVHRSDLMLEHVLNVLGECRLLTFAQAVAEIAQVSGRALHYLPVSPGDYAAALAPYLPPGEAEFLAQLGQLRP